MRRIEPTGPINATVVLVGEIPGKGELNTGLAWTGEAGDVLDLALEKSGILRDSVRVTNLRKTYSADRSEESAVAELEDFWQEMSEYRPLIVCPMGRTATRLFLGDVDMEAVHGVPHRAPAMERAVRPYIILPLYNPAAGLHNSDMLASIFNDMKVLAAMLHGEEVPVPNDDVEVDYAEGFEDWDGDDPVGIDTEGWEDSPWCVTYSVRPGHGRLIRATDKRGLGQLNARLRRVSRVVLHNSLHDLPVLEALGITIRDGQLEDTMIGAYNLQLEPQGLKPLARRYAGMEMKSYDEVTKPYDEEVCRGYIQSVQKALLEGRIEDNPEPVLEEDGQGGWKVRQPQKLATRLKRLLTKGEDFRKGWEAIDASTKAVAVELLGDLPQFTFDWVPLDEVLYYACRDSDATVRIFPHIQKKLDLNGLTRVYEIDKAIVPMVAAMHRSGIGVDTDYFAWLDEMLTQEMEHWRGVASKYNNGEWINPNSPKQVSDLLFNRLRMYTRKRTKSGAMSTNDKVLEDLALVHDHPALEGIMEYRGMSKLRDGFARAIPRMARGSRVHCTFRLTRVVSGRLSATSPNLMAIPQREGPLIRQGFVARRGWKLASADLDQVEMKVMAALSKDERFIGFMQEGRDIHSETTKLIFKKEDFEKSERDMAKRCGFGVITGITAQGLYDQTRLAKIKGYNVEKCQEVIDGWFKVYPGVRAFLLDCRDRASGTGETRDAVGRIRYLPNVWSRNPALQEEALRQSHSHPIQATAQAIIKMAMAEIWSQIRDYPDRVRPILQIHDELVFEVRKGWEGWLEEIVLSALTKNRFDWPVELTAGMNFADRWGELK